MITKRLPKQWMYVLVWVAVAGILIGTLFDYQIEKAIYQPSSLWASFFRNYGSAPLYWCLELSGLLMFFSLRTRIVWKNIVMAVGGAAIFLFGFLQPSFYALNGRLFSDYMTWVLSFVIFLVPPVSLFFLVRHHSQPRLQRLVLLLLICSVGSFLIVTIIKEIVRRPRFIALVKEPGLTFQPWWLITRKNLMLSQQAVSDPDLFRSFPSGHTSAAACAFCFCVLPYYNSVFARQRNTIFVCALIYTILMGYSRMILGYHFLTDVCGGFLCTFIPFIFCYNWLYRPKRKRRKTRISAALKKVRS